MAEGSMAFDSSLLDQLLVDAHIDCLLITSRHNVQYFLGGHYPHLFATGLTMGLGGFLPILGYFPGRLDLSFLVGSILVGDTREGEAEAAPHLWVAELAKDCWSAAAAGAKAADLVRTRAVSSPTVGIEVSHIPTAAYLALLQALRGVIFVDASALLEEMRAVKRIDEVEILRRANVLIADAINGAAQAKPGVSKRQLLESLHIEDARRDLVLHHGLIAAAPSLVRTPNDDSWLLGAPLSIDHGAEYRGYHGDVARMAILGDPDKKIVERWDEIKQVQLAAIGAIKPGVTGREVFEAALTAQAQCPNAQDMFFTAHGIGLNQHEAPRLTEDGFDAGPGSYVDRAVRSGMVISVETQMKTKSMGLLKVEDSVVVSLTGADLLDPRGLDWILVHP